MHRLITSLGPGFALGGKGEKKSAWAKKSISERSEPRGSVERGNCGGRPFPLPRPPLADMFPI